MLAIVTHATIHYKALNYLLYSDDLFRFRTLGCLRSRWGSCAGTSVVPAVVLGPLGFGYVVARPRACRLRPEDAAVAAGAGAAAAPRWHSYRLVADGVRRRSPWTRYGNCCHVGAPSGRRSGRSSACWLRNPSGSSGAVLHCSYRTACWHYCAAPELPTGATPRGYPRDNH